METATTIAKHYEDLHNQMCREFEELDGSGTFHQDPWEKAIGSGLTCVMREGALIEKGGLNYSFVQGDFTPQMERLLGEQASKYFATGISSIMHPSNPHVPIIHMNVRYFALDTGVQWFGGGIDLTPHYIDIADAKYFHSSLKAICDKYSPTFYPEYKQWADEYFFIPHRNETRGVGGIFFDRLKPTKRVSFERLLGFTTDLAQAYSTIYRTLADKKRNKPFSKKEKQWQEMRRGRYVEFNLVYDRGTKFGFESKGNTESILVSLPATAAWEYKYEVETGSAEEETLGLLKKGVDWVKSNFYNI